MTTNRASSREAALSRRRLIGAAGLTAVGIATASTGATAHADDIDPNNDAAGNPRGADTGEVSAQDTTGTHPGLLVPHWQPVRLSFQQQ